MFWFTGIWLQWRSVVLDVAHMSTTSSTHIEYFIYVPKEDAQKQSDGGSLQISEKKNFITRKKKKASAY